MANERLSDAATAFFRGQFEISVADAHKAITDGRIDDSRAAVRHASEIDVAAEDVRQHYSAIDRIYQELGLPILPIEMLTEIAPVVGNPQVEEVVVAEASPSVEASDNARIQARTIPVAEVVRVARKIVPPPEPAKEQRKPEVLTKPERAELSREERLIISAFSLNRDKTQFVELTYANIITGAFADTLPPRSAPNEVRHEAFSQAKQAHRIILTSLLDDVFAVEINPDIATEVQRQKVERLRQFLIAQGYPEDISSIEIKDVANRREGATFKDIWAVRKRRVQLGGESDSRRVFPARTERRDARAHRPSISSTVSYSEEDQGRRRRGVDQRPTMSVLGIRPLAGENLKIEMAPQDRALGVAIFSLNEDKTPVFSSLRAVAEDVFANDLKGLEEQTRKKAIESLIKTKITPYIVDRSRAVAATTNSNREDTKIRDRALAREVRYFMELYHYPNNLGPQEIGLLMSKQTTLSIILERREGGRKVAPIVPTPVEENVPKEKSTSNGKNHKDKLTDAQRAYLEATYATDGRGGILHKTRDEVGQALYPREWEDALKNPSKRNNIGLLRAHVSRVGKKVTVMVAEALQNGTGPAELRAYINNLKIKPEFQVPDDVIIAYAGR